MAIHTAKVWAASLVGEKHDWSRGIGNEYVDTELGDILTPRPEDRAELSQQATEIRALNVSSRLNPQFWATNSNPPILRRETTGLGGNTFHKPAGQSSVFGALRNEEDHQYRINHCLVKLPDPYSRCRDSRGGGYEQDTQDRQDDGDDEEDEEDIDGDLSFVLDNIHGIESEVGRLDVLAAMAQERRFVLPVLMVCLGIAEAGEQVQQKGVEFAARFIADPDMMDSFEDFVAALDRLGPAVAARVKQRVCQIRVSRHQERLGRCVAGTDQARLVKSVQLEGVMYVAISAFSNAMVRFRRLFWSGTINVILTGGWDNVLVRSCTWIGTKI